MTTIILRKVWGDLTHHKARSLLAVLSIAVGVLALGLAFGALGAMHAAIEQDELVSRPAHLTFRGAPAGQVTFHQDLIDTALRRPGVAEAEGETIVPFCWKLEGETKWRNGVLFARLDYAAQSIGRVELLNGEWPTRHTVAVERKSSQYFSAPAALSGASERI